MVDRLEQVCGLISEHVFKYTTEVDLQAELAELLQPLGARREVDLSDRISRIDFAIPVVTTWLNLALVRCIGLEVKIKGPLGPVLRQLTRYAECPEIVALILVTTKAAHHHIPTGLNGKPVKLVSLIGAGL